MANQTVASIHAYRKRIKIPWPKFMKVLTRPDLPLRANERAVALVIFMYADMNTLTCYPSIDEICRHAAVSRNTACRAIKKLVELGLVKVSKRKQEGVKFERNLYDFNPLRMQIGRVSG